jgi:hypothetical protein
VETKVVRRTGDAITVEVTFKRTGSMQEMEDAILEATKAAYRYAAEEARKLRDSDGGTIRPDESP